MKIRGRCLSIIVMKRRNISSRALVSLVETGGKMYAEDPLSDGVQPLNDGQAAGEGAGTRSY